MLNQIMSALDELGLDRAAALQTLMSNTDTLAIVKHLLGISDNSQDNTLMFVIQSIEGQILRYINWETLPNELCKVLIIMVVSYYKSAGLGTTEAATGQVASVKRGDVAVSYAAAAGSSGSASTFNLGTENSDFFGWKTVLNEYRKLRW